MIPPIPSVSGAKGRCALLASLASALVGAVAMGHMLCWLLYASKVSGFFPREPGLNFSAALGFFLAGCALWLWREKPPSGIAKMAAQAAACLVLLLAGLALAKHWQGGREPLMNSANSRATDGLWGVMPPIASVCLIFHATALLLLGTGRKGAATGQGLALSGVLVGIIVLVGNLYGVKELSPYLFRSEMSPAASWLTSLLGAGLLLAQPESRLISELTSQRLGGRWARRTLPAALLACLTIGWFRVAGEQAGWLTSEVATTIITVLMAILGAAIIWLAARSLNQLHAELEAQNRLNARFGAIVESSADAIASTDLKLIITSWNPGAKQVFGYSAEEMLGQSFEKVISRSWLGARDPSQLLNGESNSRIELTCQRQDGATILVSLLCSPIRMAAGQVAGFSLVARDITAQKQAEEKNNWLASFPERNPNPLIEFDPETGFIHYANPVTEQLFPDLRTRGLEHPMLANLQAIALDLRTDACQEVQREIEIAGKAYVQNMVKVKGCNRLRLYNADITRRAQMERALRDTESKLKAVIQNLNDGLVILDIESKQVHRNPAAMRLFGFDDSGPQASELSEVMKLFELRTMEGRLLPADEWPLVRAMRGESFKDVALRVRRSQIDLERVFNYSGITFHDANGKKVAFLTIQDITNRTVAERALRAAQERLEIVVRNLNEGLVIMEVKSQLMRWNPAAMRMHGFAPLADGNCSLPAVADLFELFTPSGLLLTRDEWPIARVVHGETLSDLVLLLQRKDKEWVRFFSYSGMVVHDSADQAIAFLTMQDITDRLNAEQQLERSFREITHLKTALDEHAIIAITNPQGQITYVNDKFCAISQYAREELLGQDHRMINSGHHPKEFFRDLWQTIARGKVWHGEIKNRAKDGGFYWVDTTIVPFLDQQGKPWQYVAVRADITRLKNAEEAIRKSEMRFRQFMDRNPAIAWMKDAQGRHVYLNKTYENTFGVSLEEWRGKTDLELWPREIAERLIQSDREIMAQEQPREGIEEIADATGKTRYWFNLKFPFQDADGQRYVAGIGTDITERKLAEERIQHYNRELERSNQDLEQFAYVASHDLQEPLRAVAGCLQLLQRRVQAHLDAKAEELIRHAVEGSQRMKLLIEGLLAFSRVGTRELEHKPVSCDAVIDEALKNLSTAIRESGVSITRDNLPVLRADAIQLALLFQNLIGNAIKFRGKNPCVVHIGAEHKNGQWIIAVRDNGIGIEAQYFERIFVIFQRLHTRSEYPGTGIGLSMCKKIVERHGGSIWVESTPNQGSTFYCAFPEQPPNTPPRQAIYKPLHA